MSGRNARHIFRLARAAAKPNDWLMSVKEQNLLPMTAGSCPPGIYQFAPGRFAVYLAVLSTI